MLRAEYIFNPLQTLHQGRTYSPENNIFFCITVDTCLLTEERVGKLEVKKHEGRGHRKLFEIPSWELDGKIPNNWEKTETWNFAIGIFL